MSEESDDIVQRLRVDACDMGGCYAKQNINGLHLMRWQETATRAVAEILRLRGKIMELEHANGLTRVGREDTHP